MNISLKPLGLTISSLTITTAVLLVTLCPPSWASDVYLDRQCKRTNDKKDAFRVDFRRNIQPGGKPYWFSMARYMDGTPIFCLSQPNYTQGKLVARKEWQNQFIREVKQETQETSFLITVAYGNGRRVPLTQFRLNLDDPTQPKLTKLKEWRDSK